MSVLGNSLPLKHCVRPLVYCAIPVLHLFTIILTLNSMFNFLFFDFAQIVFADKNYHNSESPSSQSHIYHDAKSSTKATEQDSKLEIRVGSIFYGDTLCPESG